MRAKVIKGKKRRVGLIRAPREPKTVHLPAPTQHFVVGRDPGDAARLQREVGAETIAVPGVGGRAPGAIRFKNEPRFAAQSLGKPCQSKRKNCPVQLIFTEGQAQLRFCKRAGNKEPGYVVPVNSPDEAQQVASEACAYWTRRKSFEGFFKPGHPLGGARRARRR